MVLISSAILRNRSGNRNVDWSFVTHCSSNISIH